ncbi:MAG: GTP-binding protein [Thermoproteota archaeon]
MSSRKISLVMVGHKDHGKSTLIGRLLYDSQAIPEEKITEIKRETQNIGKFRFSYLLDSLEEERAGGLTIDIMHTPFKTSKRLYHIIDCPGHREFVKNMITGASQADAAVLVVSAQEGIQDQTRQHAFLTKTLGINQLVAVINKMDQVSYQEPQYQKTRRNLTSFLEDLGYEEVSVVPISAMNGDNVYHKSQNMPWYSGPPLTETLDNTITPTKPPLDKPVRGIVQDTYPYQDYQRIVACKIETGTLHQGEPVVFNPSGKTGTLKKILASDTETEQAAPGDSVGLLIEGVNTVPRGEVLSTPKNPPPTVEKFTAQIILLSDIQLTNGNQLTIRYGTARKRCQVHRILTEIDPTQLTTTSQHPSVLSGDSVGKVQFTPLEPICLEEYSTFPPLGRFVIEGKKGTAAAGIILETTHPHQ